MTIDDVSQIRSLLDKFMNSAAKADVSPLSKDVVAGFRKSHETEIRKASKQLEDIALTKLLADVSRRKRYPNIKDEQSDLFADYLGIPSFIAVSVGQQSGRASRWKPFSDAKLSEVQSWLDGKRKVQTRKFKHRGVTALMRDLEPFASSADITVKEAFAAKTTAIQLQLDLIGSA